MDVAAAKALEECIEEKDASTTQSYWLALP